jgi:hypothetical protein
MSETAPETQIPPDTQIPIVTRLDIGFSDMEDRLLLSLNTAGHGVRNVLITRRMMRVLLENYANVLKRTSETASHAPVEARDEVLRMEHVGALASMADAAPDAAQPTPDGQDGGAPGAVAPPHMWLAVEIKMQMAASVILIAFFGQCRNGPDGDSSVNEPIAAMTLNRPDAHRVLDLLVRKSKEAGWGLDHYAAWLAKAGMEAATPAVN